MFKCFTDALPYTDYYNNNFSTHVTYFRGFLLPVTYIRIKLVYPLLTISNGRRLSLVTMNTSEHKETIKRIALQLSESKKKPSSIFWTNQLDIKLVEMVAY